MADLEWVDTPGGIRIAPLWVDPEIERHGQMVKLARSSPGAVRKHTHAYRAVIISGASKHWVQGQTADDVALQGPGDFWYQAGGQNYQDQFPTDGPTVLYVAWDGQPDTQMLGE
ncbi:cupin domain-containing protein [Phaeobacter sp. C3_T13_0]|uniref:cupin domain-containing protein n=1 Tax=Phaeobacter cretensis TaxID=3342641 RepID=UPI0039BC6C36